MNLIEKKNNREIKSLEIEFERLKAHPSPFPIDRSMTYKQTLRFLKGLIKEKNKTINK